MISSPPACPSLAAGSPERLSLLQVSRPPEALKAKGTGKTVFIVEGEKDVDDLSAMGPCAATNPGGAKQWRSEFGADPTDCDVVIIPDKDDPGREHARLVAHTLRHRVRTLRRLEMLDRDGRPVRDVSDWIAGGGTSEQFLQLVLEARHVNDGPQSESTTADGREPLIRFGEALTRATSAPFAP